MMDPAFVRTKLKFPTYRADWILRSDLLARLDAGVQRKLTLLSAPAGFGKTSLLRAWIQHHHNTTRMGTAPRFHFAWYSLDEGDNDPSRFLAYLIQAFAEIRPTGGALDLEDLATSPAFSLQTSLNQLINVLDDPQPGVSSDRRVILILDDYHAILADEIHQVIRYLLDHMPAALHLVMASRADPPFSLARLRARGEILELRAADLRFTPEETRQLLNQVMGLNLSNTDVVTLEERTEGWIAGIHMAALAMQALPSGNGIPSGEFSPGAGSSTGSDFIRTLSGSNRYIMDYLVEEVLQRLPHAVQTFLLKTSILEELCAPLCAAVLAEPGAEADPEQLAGCVSILDSLDRTNVFVFPLDDRREWYRYHRLFADLLRKRLNVTLPGQAEDLHRRASEWFEYRGLNEQAVEHAFHAGEPERAARLVAKAAEGLMLRSEIMTLRRWLELLPDSLLATYPMLCVYQAWGLFMDNSPLTHVEERLSLMQASSETQFALAAPVKAYIAAFRGMIPQAAALAQQALDCLPDEAVFLRSMATIVLATCELSEGDPIAGYRSFEQTARLSHQTGNILASVIALASLAENYRKQGHLRQAETCLHQALELAVDARGRYLPIAGRVLCGLGELLREWNQLEEAARTLEQGIELLRQWGTLAAYTGHISLAKLRQEQGDHAAAAAILHTAQELAAQTRSTPIDDWVVDMASALLSISSGDLAAAEAWVDRRGLLQNADLTQMGESELFGYVHLRKYELIVVARLRLAQGRPTEALQILDSLLPQVTETSRVGLLTEIQTLRAVTFHTMGRHIQALTALDCALSSAQDGGYMRIFLDEGEPVYMLLSEVDRKQSSSTYIASLLTAFEQEKARSSRAMQLLQTPTPPGNEPLSERELEVLLLLQSRLTAPEMAQTLCVAESTVRSHIKNIYSKLGVHRRMDALSRAVELGLLSKSPS